MGVEDGALIRGGAPILNVSANRRSAYSKIDNLRRLAGKSQSETSMEENIFRY